MQSDDKRYLGQMLVRLLTEITEDCTESDRKVYCLLALF